MRKVRSLRIPAAISAAALLLLCVGCADEPVVKSQRRTVEITLSWWGNDARNEYTIAAVEQFEALHPDIKVNCSYSEWTGYEARSKVQMVSGTEADVMQINFNWLPQYSPDGTGYYDLEELSEYIDFSNFSQDMLEYGRMNGVLNAIPIAMNTETIYINETLYSKYGLSAPKTWDDLFTAAAAMRDDGIYPLAGAAKSIWLYLISYAEQTAGKTFVSDSGELQFTASEFQLMLEMYARMVEEHVIPQVEYFARSNIDNNTYAGAVAWVSDAVNYFTTSIENGNTISVVDYTNVDPTKSGNGWYAKPATLYAVSKNTEQPKEAALLLDFLLNSQEMALLQGVEKGIPLSSAAKGYLEEEQALSGIQYEACQKMEQTENLAVLQPFFENATLVDEFIAACNLVVFDKADAADAAAEFYQTARSLYYG